ncbi:MAG: peptidoglycan DD-metalloendopeptidase family protein [Pseudomonadota bacterium]|nr:peptidoglycan DD-metalloendopeptidase family protein [Pseudomonadota bacterium]
MRALEAAEAGQLEALRSQMRATWMLARREPLQMLLEAESADRIGRLLYFNRHLAEARGQHIERWQAEGRKLAEQTKALDAALARLRSERDALRERSAELDASRRQRSATLTALESQIERRKDNAEELRATRAELSALLDRLVSAAQPKVGLNFKDARGRLPWPAAPRLLQTFGRPRPPGNLPAQGVLISADPGTPIRAVAAGEVVFADWLRGFGLLAVVDHGNGYMSLYGQLESLIRKVGDSVEAGEQLATAGRSGGSARSGVWFEVRNQGEPEDPVAWCVPRATG